jgi:hypothetical protein
MNVLPDRCAIDDTYFTEEIISGLEAFCYPEGRNSHERHVALHFDNAQYITQRR